MLSRSRAAPGRADQRSMPFDTAPPIDASLESNEAIDCCTTDVDAFEAEVVRAKYGLGIGSPAEEAHKVDRLRDITVKPRPLSPSSVSPSSRTDSFSSFATLSSAVEPQAMQETSAARLDDNRMYGSTTLKSSTRMGQARVHATIPSPIYVQRSQPIQQLHRSNSSHSSDGMHGSGSRLQRSGSTSSINSDCDGLGEGGEVVAGLEVNRPLKHRSESLPVFPPVDRDSTIVSHVISLDDLPANPKQWLPSHLSVYLSHQLSLHPRLAEDITHFIRSSALSGRTFMRLNDADMVEMGINIRWRSVLLDARETLRRQTLGGRIWGFGGGGNGNDFAEVAAAEGLTEGEEETKMDWKKSWRQIKARKTRGRVKGMASVFDGSTASPSAAMSSFSSRQQHRRSDSSSSSTSTASIDSGSNISPSSYSAATLFHQLQLSTSTDANGVHSSSLTSNSTAFGRSISTEKDDPSHSSEPFADSSTVFILSRSSSSVQLPIGESRPHFQGPTPTDGFDDQLDGEDEFGSATVKSGPTASAGHKLSTSRGSLSDLFGFTSLKGSSSRRIIEKKGDDVDLLSAHVGDGKGSMIIVRRSQLQELEKRMAEVEAQLALAMAAPPDTSQLDDSFTIDGSTDQSTGIRQGESKDPAGAGAAAAHRNLPNSWISLGGYVLAASIGIGIIAGEVVVGKLFGGPARR